MAKKLIIGALLGAALATSTAALASDYVGNAATHKFHTMGCARGQKIREDNRVYFNSREEACNAGYVPCKVCDP